MDTFLTKLYHEELEKNASSQQAELFQALGVTDLEDLLGLQKVAVGGPITPDLSPAMKKSVEARETKGKDAEKRVVQANSKSETQPDRNIAPLTPGQSVPERNFVQPDRSIPETTLAVKQAAVDWADQMGRKLAHVQKQAEEEVRPESWYKGQRGMARASRAGDKGLDLALAHPELIGKRTIKSLKHGLVGGASGAALGGAAGAVHSGGKGALLGALTGAALGSGFGGAHGQYSADKEWLGKHGIRPTLLGFGRGRFSPEAAEKYLKDKEKDSAAMCKAAAVQRGIKLASQLPASMLPALIETTAFELRKSGR